MKAKIIVEARITVEQECSEDVLKEYLSMSETERIVNTAAMLRDELGADIVEILSYKHGISTEAPKDGV
ncbi:hypothetical protein SPFL3102_03570 [Sporomusaceae bacterium FL31]|nr:hypothetical protein SPFL3101_00435 [Sporomusaceae bacterium FL31]GCE35719.1 hypothetical protein SPFL3102_03570 [Sporomusaceae bacterium]